MGVGIRIPALGAAGLLLGSVILGLTLLSSQQLREQRRQFEETAARADLQRALVALERTQENRHRGVMDYAQWDSSWTFLEDDSDTYREEDIGETSLPALDADALLITRLDGAISHEIDPEDMLSDETWARWVALLGEQPAMTLAEVDGTPWMLVSAPVLHTDGSGPIQGIFVAARRCDAAFLDGIAALTLTQVSLAPVSEPVPDLTVAADHITTARVLEGLAGRYVLQVRSERLLEGLALPLQRQALAGMLGVGVLLLALLGVWLDRRVLRPVERLRAEVAQIHAAPEADLRLTVPRRGPLERLVQQLNALLDRLAAQAADLRQARQVAEASVAARTRFVANMSHEIRTPLNAIIGTTEVLRRTSPTPEQAALLADQQAAAQALLSLLSGVLDFARLESGHLELVQEPFDLRALCQDTLRVFSASAQERQLHLTADLPDAPVHVAGDPARIRQILLNLVGNALKFTPADGLVTLSLEWAQGRAQLAVADTGIGIPEGQRERVFEPFAQVDGLPGTLRVGGTGLGLTICRQLARAMGGDITVESTEGRGSTFQVHLPLPASAPPQARSAAEAPVPPRRVLVAEDNLLNQRVIRMLLERDGHSVVLVPDGLAAVQAALSDTDAFDIVLMDLHMPRCDGLEAARRLRAAGYRVPIIAFSANTSQEDVDACRAAGMDGLLPKPVDVLRLRDALRQQTTPGRSGAAGAP